MPDNAPEVSSGLHSTAWRGGAMRLRRSTGRLPRGSVALVALAFVFALLTTSCGGGGSSGPTTYSVFAQKFRLHTFPSSIPSGNMIIDFSNRENLPILHEMILLALPSGQTAKDVVAAGR